MEDTAVWSEVVTCRRCSCPITITADNLIYEQFGSQLNLPMAFFFKARCDGCEANVKINTADVDLIPREIRESTKERFRAQHR